MALQVDESCDSLRTLLKHEELPVVTGTSDSSTHPNARALSGKAHDSSCSRKGVGPKDSISIAGSREGTPIRTPTRTPISRRKDLLAIGGIEIEKRRSSSSASYRIENNKVRQEQC